MRREEKRKRPLVMTTETKRRRSSSRGLNQQPDCIVLPSLPAQAHHHARAFPSMATNKERNPKAPQTAWQAKTDVN